MTTLTLELPEEVFSALRRSPEEFGRELRLTAAIHMPPCGRPEELEKLEDPNLIRKSEGGRSSPIP